MEKEKKSELEQSIRAKISEFLAKQIDLETLYDWLVPIVWDIDTKKDPPAKKLLYSVELTIYEYTFGKEHGIPSDILESELQSNFKKFLNEELEDDQPKEQK